MVSMPVSTQLVDWDHTIKMKKKTSSSKNSILSGSLIDIQAENYFQVKSINCYLREIISFTKKTTLDITS